MFASSQSHALVGSGDHDGVMRACGDGITMDSLVELLVKAPPELVAALHQVANDITGAQLPLGRGRFEQRPRDQLPPPSPPPPTPQQQPAHLPHHSPLPPSQQMHGHFGLNTSGPSRAAPPQPESELAVPTMEGLVQSLVADGEVPEGFELLLAVLQPPRPTSEVQQGPQPEPWAQNQAEAQLQCQPVPQPNTERATQLQQEPQLESQHPQHTPEPAPTGQEAEAEAGLELSEEPSPTAKEPAHTMSGLSASVETPEPPTVQESVPQGETKGSPEGIDNELPDVDVDELLAALAAANRNPDEHAGMLEEILNGKGVEDKSVADEPVPDESVADGDMADVDVEALLGELAAPGEDSGALASPDAKGDEMTEEALERIIKECGFDPMSVALETLNDEQLINLDSILSQVTREKNKESEQMQDPNPEITDAMSVDEIDDLLYKLNSESDRPSVNTSLGQPSEAQSVPQASQPLSAKDSSEVYTAENVRAILSAVFGGIGAPLPPRQETPRPLKRPSSVSYPPPPPAKRQRGPSPHHLPSAVNQLQGIVQTSANLLRPPPTPPPLSPAFVASFGSSEDMNRRLMAMKPPPYRPGGGAPRRIHSTNSAPTPLLGATTPLPAKPKSGEDEKRIKAMGFPPMLAGVKRKAE